MATMTYPKRWTTNRALWIISGVIVIVAAIAAALTLVRPSATTSAATVAATRGSLTAAVSGTGTIVADQSLDLAFSSSGTVAEVFVEEGDLVTVGQPLARLDTRDLALQVASAEASLASAQAQFEQRRSGNATPEQISASQASVSSAEANLEKARTNNVTAADIAEAEAQLRSAQAQLDDLLAGPKPDELATAQSSYDEAVASLASQRTSLAVAKERARSELEQAANSLRDAQDDYSKIYWDNRELERLPGDLSQERINEEAAAQRAVTNAEQTLAQQQLAYEQARTDEQTGITKAEAQLREAETKLTTTKAGATQAEIEQARASVDQYRARLNGLRVGGSSADIAVAQASLDQARANLAELTAPATPSDLRIQAASVAQAEQSLAQATLALEQATLVAPFAGVITSVDIVPGSIVSGAVMHIVDRDPLHVDLKLSENDVAKVGLDMPVTLKIDALPALDLNGKVSFIATAADDENGVVTYRVQVNADDVDEAVKVGMTANLDIVYATKDHALLVPTSALLPNGAGYVVQVPAANGQTEEIPVEVGLSDGANSEILSGLSDGQQVIALPGQN